jgi:FlaA1/EpsC-like NDP-sugar epimerase
MNAVGFLDDDASKWAHVIQGLPVYLPEELEKFIQERKIDTVVISTKKISRERVDGLKHRCDQAGISLRMLHIGMDEIAPTIDDNVEVRRVDTIIAAAGD